MEMPPPENDAKAWTGKYSSKQWEQFVAIALMAWSCFLRVSEVVNLRICHLLLIIKISLAVTVTKAKADQRGISTTTILDAAEEGSPICLLQITVDY